MKKYCDLHAYNVCGLYFFPAVKKMVRSLTPHRSPPKSFSAISTTVNGQIYSTDLYNVNFNPVIKISFAAPLDEIIGFNSVLIKDNAMRL